jgi:dTMP kinase
MMPGRLLVIEGIDGSGKSTQVNNLSERLMREGKDFRYQKFPRYDNPSSQLLRMYLGGEFGRDPDAVNPYATSAFFAVDRAAAFLQELGEFYRSGGIILCDRYTTSNAVHQAAKLPEEEQIRFTDWLFDFEYNKLGLPEPDRVFFLDISPELSAKMIKERGQGEDIQEADIGFIVRSADAARRIAAHYKWTMIRCERDGVLRPPGQIAEEIYDLAVSLF